MGKLASALAIGALALSSVDCGGSPTAPEAPTVVSLLIDCPPSLRVGDNSLCFAQARYSDGTVKDNASPDWSSSDPGILSCDTGGRIAGRGPGVAIVTGRLGAGIATFAVSVRLEDFVDITSEGIQGLFQTGRTITMFTLGGYGVASADTGQLSVEITDQDGRLIVPPAPKGVARGGDRFVFTTTFTISTGITRVCRAAVLQLGATRLVDPGGSGLITCVDVVAPQ